MSQITIQDLSFTYEGDHVPVFQHLDLQLDTRWKLGLVGRNGRGKTTLLRLLEGSLSGGGVLTRPDRTIYFPRLVAEPERPAREILLEGIPWEEEWMLLRELNRLGLDEDILDRPFSSLSGGEQTRAGLEIESFVNGERKQHSNTRNLIFDPFHLVSYLSQALTLEPGDVIFTGTPSGVSPVHPGDVMEMRIQGIGSLINPVAAEPL